MSECIAILLVNNIYKVILYIYDIKGGDHFNIITPVTKVIAEKILNDTGEKTNITFTKEDIAKIENSLK